MKKKIKRILNDIRTNEVKANIIDWHKDYQLEYYSFRKIGEEGPLAIATLKSKTKSLFEFEFRWDEKRDEKMSKLDVDIYRNRKKMNKLWNREGYKGHHPEKRIHDCKGKRIFDVFIEIPVKRKILKIFQGDITFGLCREVQASIRIKLLTRASLKVIH